MIATHAPPSSTGPRVSIGMPVYNAQSWVAESIESILRQTFADFELIISDNASTDRTYEICAGFARSDPRVRLSRHVLNVGAIRNYRAVLASAHGEYFKWASSNDLFAPSFVAKCV